MNTSVWFDNLNNLIINKNIHTVTLLAQRLVWYKASNTESTDYESCGGITAILWVASGKPVYPYNSWMIFHHSEDLWDTIPTSLENTVAHNVRWTWNSVGMRYDATANPLKIQASNKKYQGKQVQQFPHTNHLWCNLLITLNYVVQLPKIKNWPSPLTVNLNIIAIMGIMGLFRCYLGWGWVSFNPEIMGTYS